MLEGFREWLQLGFEPIAPEAVPDCACVNCLRKFLGGCCYGRVSRAQLR